MWARRQSCRNYRWKIRDKQMSSTFLQETDSTLEPESFIEKLAPRSVNNGSFASSLVPHAKHHVYKSMDNGQLMINLRRAVPKLSRLFEGFLKSPKTRIRSTCRVVPISQVMFQMILMLLAASQTIPFALIPGIWQEFYIYIRHCCTNFSAITFKKIALSSLKERSHPWHLHLSYRCSSINSP